MAIILILILSYFIEIDTSFSFNSPLVNSGSISPTQGFLNWSSPQLTQGVYFWRVRIYDGTTYGEWSKINSFSILSQPKQGFYSLNRSLKLFNTYNINYLDSSGSLNLNTSLLPPRPSNTTFKHDIIINNPVVDSVGLTAITTDGTYIYFANIWYYAREIQKFIKLELVIMAQLQESFMVQFRIFMEKLQIA